MIYRTIVGLMIAMSVFACNQQSSKTGLDTQNGTELYSQSQSGLTIDYGINRGTGYTDSSGTKFNIRYIPVTITNDSIIPIRIQIEFSKEYDYSGYHGYQKFKVIPLSEEWALDGLEITESMITNLSKYIDNPTWNKTLDPGEKCVFAVGTHYQAINYGPVPNGLFSQDKKRLYLDCDSPHNQNKSTHPQLALALKIDFYHWTLPPEGCRIIPCGKISYPGHQVK